MKYNKYIQNTFRRKYLKTYKRRGSGNISPPILNNIKIEIKGKGKLHFYSLHYI